MACSQALGDGHEISIKAHTCYQEAWLAKQASVPLHVQLQRTQKKLGQATKKVEACHSEFESLELQVKEAVIRMQEVKQLGSKCQAELGVVEAEKASILQAMQGQAEQAKEGTNDFVQGLGQMSLEQLLALGEQIKLACRPLEQNQPAGSGPPQGKGGGGSITPTQRGGGSQGDG